MTGFTLLLFAQQPALYLEPAAFGMAVLSTLIYGAIGIMMAVLAFKVLDYLTPGKLDEEILQKQNIAAAILAGAFVLGICIIMAAAIHG